MQVLRTEQIWINSDSDDVISELCHFSKNLWNEANYIVRQEFFSNGRWTRYNTLAGTLKGSENFKALNGQTAQQILRILDRSWKAFFASIKEWSNHPEKFLGRPKLPGYKPKDGEFMLVFTNQQVKIENGYLIFPKKLPLKIETRLGDETNIREVRIIPKGIGYICEIVYEKTVTVDVDVKPLNLNPDNIIGLDLGLRNTVTIGNNIGVKPIAIKGGVLKSINQYYNKVRAQIQSIYDHQDIKTGSAIQIVTEKRNRKIKDILHKISRFIINYCIKYNIGTGHNDNWKQNADLGKKNNQNFVSIPYNILIHNIQYKAEELGITVKLQEESHTSKCSFLDNETIEHHDNYMGKRMSRGLFRSAKGIIINADVNGSLNTIKKAVSKAFSQSQERADEIEGVGLHPERLNVFKQKILSFENVCCH